MSEKKTVVITGATSGLGEAAARAFAGQGFYVVALGRDRQRGAALVDAIAASGGAATFLAADLFSVAGALRAAADVRALTAQIDVLVNNAGGMFSSAAATPDGVERTVALNLVAPFVLSEALLGELSRAGGRIVNLVTNIPKGAKATPAELVGPVKGAGVGAYTKAKLALLALTREQQRRYASVGVTAVSLHPGIIPDTGFGQDLPRWLRRFGGVVARLFGFASTLEQAAARYLAVATGPVTGGAFYDQGALAAGPTLGADPSFAAQVWSALDSARRRGAVAPAAGPAHAHAHAHA